MWHHNHIWLNDANKHYIQEDKEEDRSTMAQKATMIYYKSLPNCPTKNKQRQLYTFSFLMFQQAKEGNKISVECNFSLFRVSTYSVSTNLQPLLFSIHFCGGFFLLQEKRLLQISIDRVYSEVSKNNEAPANVLPPQILKLRFLSSQHTDVRSKERDEGKHAPHVLLVLHDA